MVADEVRKLAENSSKSAVDICKRLPSEITDYLMNIDDPETLKFFTERRLRPLTLMATDDDKITRFKEMVEAINID
ncbi:hypothetical protein DSCW_59490 [Desulfosarcina widdelii]|uniref:Uncharacterized protein n=1 Tax=Desulfosarcina widdelii TaxID=947919 RepID=A0A5K7Z931_9BACT|nr:hypothetical protein DSCW_59490 [Desulfosarcina widdelii]